MVPGADASLGDLLEALEKLPRGCYVLDLPPRRHLAKMRTPAALAGVLAQAVLAAAPGVAGGGAVAVAGVGLGGVVAHELAVQLTRAGVQVRFSVWVRARVCLY